MNYTSLSRIYGLVQCTPDISPVDCNTCLHVSVVDILSLFDGKQGGRVLRPSCNVRYEIYPFYQSRAATVPATSSASLTKNRGKLMASVFREYINDSVNHIYSWIISNACAVTSFNINVLWGRNHESLKSLPGKNPSLIDVIWSEPVYVLFLFLTSKPIYKRRHQRNTITQATKQIIVP